MVADILVGGIKITEPDKYGGKAAGLSTLVQNGYHVPDYIAIEAVEDTQCFSSEFWENLREKIRNFEDEGYYDVAVRSSAVGEDSFVKSMAREYASKFGKMTFDEIKDAVIAVVESMPNSSREKHLTEHCRMGVVIQRRLEPEYAGVLLSSNPMNYKKSEMLLSVVKGEGEQLVSGNEPGEDFLISDEMEDICDQISCGISKEIIRELLSGVKILENTLRYPVDVEWAIQNDRLYYLQARPIASITALAQENFCVSGNRKAELTIPLVSNVKIHLWEKLKKWLCSFRIFIFMLEMDHLRNSSNCSRR